MFGSVIGGQIGAAILTSYAVGGGFPDEEAYTIAFGLAAAAAAVASGVAVFITSPFRARRGARAAEALE